MCTGSQPTKEQVREWLRRRRAAQSLPEMEEITIELSWFWCPCARRGMSGATAMPNAGGVRPGAIADALGLEPPSLVRVIDQLVEAGLVERHDDVSDRRAKTLHLTAAGRQCATRLETALIPFRRNLFESIDKSD